MIKTPKTPFHDTSPYVMPAIPEGCDRPDAWPPPDDFWQAIVVAVSGGIDSQAALLRACRRFGAARVIALYNDTGDEHSADNRLLPAFPGTRAWIQQECDALGVPLVVTDDRNVLLLTQQRGMWPDAAHRFCTSGTKRDPSNVVLRHLILDEVTWRGMWPGPGTRFCTAHIKTNPSNSVLRRVGLRRILFISGELRAESPGRAKLPAFELRTAAMAPTLGRLVVWHRSMLDWSKEDEIRYIWAMGREIAPPYWIGWPRFSCRHCFFQTWEQAVLAFVAYPESSAEFVRIEDEIRHKGNLAYQHIRCDGTTVVGYRAAGEFVYGDDWRGDPRPPLPRAMRIVSTRRAQARRYLLALRNSRAPTRDD